MTHSHEFVTAVATIAAKAAAESKAHRWGWTLDEIVEFAWFSVGQVGDASIDDIDFDRHVKMYRSELKENAR